MSQDSEAEHIREVFALFGLAMYQAQCLEKEIGSVLSGPCLKDFAIVTRFRYDQILDENLLLTLGQQVCKLREVPQAIAWFGQDIWRKLEEAVEARNQLAHHYFWDRCVEFTRPEGRDLMIGELRQFAALFKELASLITAKDLEWMTQMGLAKEDLETELSSLLAVERTPSRRGRKLRKKEILVGVHTCILTDEQNQTDHSCLLLEFADGTFWSFSDSGLTYGPENAGVANLERQKAFDKALPAEITPRPKGASNWSYSIPLSTGYKLEVQPRHEQPLGFSCVLRQRKSKSAMK